MKSEYFSLLKRFFLLTVALLALAGCGSSSSTSTTSATTNSDTGAVAVKLVWNGSGSTVAKTPEKTLLLAPAGVATVRIIVSGVGISPDIQSNFAASAGTGEVPGIPAGSGRTVTAQGLDSGGTVLYQGIVSNITVTAGLTTNVGTITMVDVVPPVTTASPVGGTYASAQNVSLTANEPATIFYTTNGDDPSTPGSPSGPSTGVNILISTPTTLKFFAVDTAGNKETTKSVIYTITLGTVSFTLGW